jgi:phosphoglycerate dehydrogenase-like enzyme
MPPHALLVNVSRGQLVDEPALMAALHERRLGGAVLDVTATEPLPPDSPLWSAPNLWITPHMAGGTLESRARSLELLVENLDRYLAGDRNLVNRVDLSAELRRA